MRCELSIFIVNMLRYISLKDKKGNTITNAFQKNEISLIASQIKYGETTKTVIFKIYQ